MIFSNFVLNLNLWCDTLLESLGLLEYVDNITFFLGGGYHIGYSIVLTRWHFGSKGQYFEEQYNIVETSLTAQGFP